QDYNPQILPNRSSFNLFSLLAFETAASYYGLPIQAAVFIPLDRRRSYTSPPTHSRCSKTASFRATATTARFFAFFFPLAAIPRPHLFRSVSGPRRLRIYCAHCTSSVRRYPSPSLLIRISGSLFPLWLLFGRRPGNGPTSRLFSNRAGSSSVSTNVNAVIGPTPGTCRNCAVSFA